ncbi:DUF2064 domain-containing protein [Neolewinella lacunae]|uniref:DUF2064 domain-containing protein n=1 Tax=Neolewinella lacunae TaxID=1517758 RepID=A0A923PLH5_9BACT|nr:DUF2064 domain-containing protein [Neolewinella lacunae]MBC6993408.1 DUF2064 domain-containing protein [Neolewinella lacunae]MDN3636316.1 DUF2064 domain-containing protein [Neolewinella lacunae]
MITPARTAILLFSRTAEAEARAKRFGSDDPGGRQLAGQLIARAEATVAATGLPVFRSDEATQQGDGFGERLANAMASVYALGYDRLLVVGNDCPSLRPAHLRSAAQRLERGQNLLGPDRRGGVWLIGLQREDFNAAAFAGLRWETEGLYASLAAYCPEAALLPRLADINHLQDLRTGWHFLRRALAALLGLLTEQMPVFPAPTLRQAYARNGQLSGRAPPTGEG